MASRDFNPKTGKSRLFFRYGGKQFNKTIAVKSDREAERACALIEETIQDLERGKLTMPSGVDPAAFLISGGKVAEKKSPVSNPFQAEPASPTLGSIFETYTTTLTAGSKELNSIETEAVHARHFRRVLGSDRSVDSLSLDVIQRYVDTRAREGVVRETIRKELATLRVIWGWAFKRNHLASGASWKISDLTLPKTQEHPPFQTWDQIARKIERDRVTADKKTELWECLWLDQAQTVECLRWVQANASQPFIYPMFGFAAYTGARRGEILRSERDDWDFDSGIVSIRQKKADKSKSFTRRNVPIHPCLAEIMNSWFGNHPGGPWTIANQDAMPIGGRMATKYFRAAVKGGKWSVLHGWHTFRHSLASNMASAGVDQRVINEILGHHTEEMERRYRHLLPKNQRNALNGLFQVTPVE